MIDGLLGLGRDASEVRLQPGEQLARPERLRHVVIGAGRQRADLGLLLTDGREHDHGHIAPLAQPPAQLDAIPIGEQQVDDRRLGTADGGDVERLLHRRRRQRLESAVAQNHPEGTQDLLFVVADKHSRSCRGVHALTFTGGRSSGSATTKVVPWPGRDSTEIVPPLASTKPFAIARPRPDPGQWFWPGAPR